MDEPYFGQTLLSNDYCQQSSQISLGVCGPHATYLCNRLFTKHLPNPTPYEGWYNKKPNVSHLCEFGAPVCILLQGQKIDWKMQPKSKWQIYVSFDDGTGAIKYYNAEMHNVLTSRNFKQIIPPQTAPIPEDVDITPDSRPEGESNGDAPPTGITGSDDITPTLEPGSSRKCRRKWVNDSLLFALTDQVMDHMKDALSSEWELK